MPLDLWSRTDVELRQRGDGQFELVERWTGDAANYADWLQTRPAGWRSVTVHNRLRGVDDGTMTVELMYQADPAGNAVPPTSNEYGLIRRSWQLVGSFEQLPIEQAASIQELAEADETWIQRIRQYVMAYQAATRAAFDKFPWGERTPDPNDWPSYGIGKEFPPAGTATALPGTDPDLVERANVYASMLLANPEYTMPVASYVLSKVEEVANYTSLRISHENVGRHLSYAKLTSDEPTLAVYPLLVLSGLQDRIWLKYPPQVRQASGGTYELQQEYHAFIRPPEGSLAEKQRRLLYGEIL